jgi:AraC-like DNA-binding protein
MTRSIIIGPGGNVKLFGVRFQPFGAYCFLRVPMAIFADRTDGLDLLMSEGESALRDSLLEAETFAGQISAFETEVGLRIANVSAVDHRLAYAVRRFGDIGGAKVSSLAAEIGWSERKLERDFAKYVGLSPKIFGRVSRFSSMVRALESHGPLGLIDHTHEYGYYDQSHMINEFREFSGESPTAFYERSHRLSEFFTVGE